MTNSNKIEKIQKFLQLKIEKSQKISEELHKEIYGFTNESNLIDDNLKPVNFNQIKALIDSEILVINEVEKYLNSELGELPEHSIKFLNVLFVNKNCIKNKISLRINDNDKNKIHKYVELFDQILLFNKILFFFKNLLFYNLMINTDEGELIELIKKLFEYIRYVAPRTILKNDTRSQKEKANITSKQKAKLDKIFNEFKKLSQQISILNKFDSSEIKSLIIIVKNEVGRSTKINIPNEYVNNLINISAIKNTFSYDYFSLIHKQKIQEDDYGIILSKGVPVVIDFLKKYTVSNVQPKQRDQLAFVYDLFVFIGLLKKDEDSIHYRLLIDDKNNYLKQYLKHPLPLNYRL